MTQKRSTIRFSIYLILLQLFLYTNSCLSQSNTSQADRWKSAKLDELSQQLKARQTELRLTPKKRETLARKTWLNNWAPGKLPAAASIDPTLPIRRSEPILNSRPAETIRAKLKQLESNNDQSVILLFNTEIANNPNDVALQQTKLHWLDELPRRKTYLSEIELASKQLILLLANRKESGQSDPAKPTDLKKQTQIEQQGTEQIELARQFAMYRRARALAYRELPDVVERFPIKDHSALDQQMKLAYKELTDAASTTRTEFILLEIRMLRRAGQFGTALILLEKYGSAITPKWYLKKRRDLLGELNWKIPHAEAAKIYADNFPEEVAKEKARK